jgi:nucleoside-diphosphate kinase
MERTLIIIKPDAVQRGLIGEIIGRFERHGFKIVGLKFVQIEEQLARRLYATHEGKPFYEGLIAYMISAPVAVILIEGLHAIQMVRQMLGATDPLNAAPGTIRADYGLEVRRNLAHGSDSVEAATYEASLFFAEGELVDWSRDMDRWILV